MMVEEQSFSVWSQVMFDKSGMPTVCKVNQHKDTRVRVLSMSSRCCVSVTRHETHQNSKTSGLRRPLQTKPQDGQTVYISAVT